MTTKKLTKKQARRQAARDRQARRARTNPNQPYHNTIGANLCRAMLRSYANFHEAERGT